MIKNLKRIFKNFLQLEFEKLRQQSITDRENILIQNGRLWSHLINKEKIRNIQDAEFKVFSQWGDDGIIQYLVSYLNIENKTFIEFGVEDYSESNTRFLLMNDNWSGLVMDGSDLNIDRIRKATYFWRYNLTAKRAFITKENINELIGEEEYKGEIGLLHIDIDGNDYWVWKELKIVDPIILIIEYNSVFGPDKAITIPYKADFVCSKAHFSHLYFGASLSALVDLGVQKGYTFIGSNSAGNNAYFVKNKYLKDLKPQSITEGFVESKFRQARNENGKLNYLNWVDSKNTIKGLPVFNTKTEAIENF